MSNLIPFSFEGAAVRVIEKSGDPWFVAADVCAVLELPNVGQALSRLDDDEKASVSANIINRDVGSGGRDPAIVSESGLYSLVLTSRKPAAKRFKKWVTSEVLPSIRKTGSFGAPQIDLSNPDHLIGLLTTYANDKRELLATVAQQAPKVEAFDRIANADGLFSLERAAKDLGQPPRAFNKRLQAEDWIFRRPGAGKWTAYSDRIKAGLLEHKTFTGQKADGSDFASDQVMVTPKGLAKLALMFGAQVTA